MSCPRPAFILQPSGFLIPETVTRHGPVRQDQARSQEDPRHAEHRRSRPVQGRRPAGRRRLSGRPAGSADQDRHGRAVGPGHRGRSPHPVSRPRRRDGRRAGDASKQKLRTLLAQTGIAHPFRRRRADRDHGGRGERGRKDDVDRQADLPVRVAGQKSGAGGRRHVSGRRGRATLDLGRSAGRADRDRIGRERSGQRGA